jgi:hypothetical protein
VVAVVSPHVADLLLHPAVISGSWGTCWQCVQQLAAAPTSPGWSCSSRAARLGQWRSCRVRLTTCG